MMDELTQEDRSQIPEEKVQMLHRIPLSSLLIQAEDSIRDRQYARWQASTANSGFFRRA
ncbi:hypothetical protein [Brevibacillus borstelensis]|uniref:hypothetical protein n=1 Tax=Brevibacillus borstelensis TaxID=45462 RepID=UPI0030BD0D66